MRKKILFALIALLAGFQLMNAIPARPGLYTVTQPDGTKLVLRQYGDEFAHWLTDASGQVVRQDEDGFYRPVSGDVARQLRRGAPARRAAARRVRAAKSGQPVATGQKHFLVILVEFSDKSFTTSDDPNAAFTALMNEEGYSVDGGTGSARDFYRDNSHGVFDPIFDVYGPVKLQNPLKYYGENDYQGNDKRPEEAIIEGCTALDEDIDFTRYDNDGDGYVDLVFMYYAGRGEADSGMANTIWPHQYELSSVGKHLTLDGVKIDSYACTNEVVSDGGDLNGKMCGIGTACHEFGHAMGLPDFYDVDYNANRQSAGLFFFSTMDSGAYNNAGRTPPYFNIEERILLGWLDDSALREFPEAGTYTIPSVNENVAYRTPTDMDGEYFVYECRGSDGWDAGLLANGLLVYHVDKSDRIISILDAYGNPKDVAAGQLWRNWQEDNAINENGKHPCFYVVPSVDQDNLIFGHTMYYGNYYFVDRYAPQIPFPGSDGVDTYVPYSWNDLDGNISFRNISYANGTVTLEAVFFSGEMDYITIADAGSYRAGDRFTFALVRPEEAEAPASVVWYYDDEPAGADSVTLTAGAHVVDARLAFADGRQETVTLEIEVQ